MYYDILVCIAEVSAGILWPQSFQDYEPVLMECTAGSNRFRYAIHPTHTCIILDLSV